MPVKYNKLGHTRKSNLPLDRPKLVRQNAIEKTELMMKNIELEHKEDVIKHKDSIIELLQESNSAISLEHAKNINEKNLANEELKKIADDLIAKERELLDKLNEKNEIIKGIISPKLNPNVDMPKSKSNSVLGTHELSRSVLKKKVIKKKDEKRWK